MRVIDSTAFLPIHVIHENISFQPTEMIEGPMSVSIIYRFYSSASNEILNGIQESTD